MGNPLICGVDGSDGSNAAAAAAARLAHGLRLPLVLAQVTDDNIAGRGSEDLSEQLRNSLREAFEGIAVEGRTLRGDPAQALCELAADEDATLVVVGSRGRGMMKAALLGSVSWKVVRGADRPVMVVPHPATAAQSRDSATVVCGVDDSAEAKGAARVAAELAAALGLELVVLHSYLPSTPTAAIPAPGVTPPIDHEQVDRRQRTDAQQLVDGVAWEARPLTTPRTRVEAGDAVAALERVAEDERAELIVLGTHGRGLLASALAGSTSARAYGPGAAPSP